MEKYDLVLIGATFLSVGIAKGYKGNCLIIEPKAKPGYEFIDSFAETTGYDKECVTEDGKNLKKYFSEEGLLENPFIPEWTAFLSNYICKNNIHVLLFTNVLKLEEIENSKKLTIFNSLGRSEILADKVIDTRTNSFSYKTLNAVIYGDEFFPFNDALEEIYRKDSVRIVKVTIPNGYDYPQAREMVYSLWANRPEELKDTRLAAVADIFFEKSDVKSRSISSGYDEIYSTFYENPFLAFDEGVSIGGGF